MKFVGNRYNSTECLNIIKIYLIKFYNKKIKVFNNNKLQKIIIFVYIKLHIWYYINS